MSTVCITPFGVKDSLTGQTIPVPCGKCPGCVKRRVSAWSFRLMQEEKRSLSAYFVTLTYDTNHVPITRLGYMSLEKRDLQLFFKRLRKSHTGNGKSNIKYYACGEYGGKTSRPHYHAILFNCDIQKIQKAWNNGQVHYGTVTGASVGYCLKYISKPRRYPKHKGDDRISEFALMSKGLELHTSQKQGLSGINPNSMIECTAVSKEVKKYLCRGTINRRYIRMWKERELHFMLKSSWRKSHVRKS